MNQYFVLLVTLLILPFMNGECSTTPPPAPPAPPATPIQPISVKGYFPLVISNGSAQPNDEVYIVATDSGLTRILYYEGQFPGQMTLVPITDSIFSPDYSYTLSSFPTSTTGNNDFVLYMPNEVSSCRVYLSIGNPLFFLNNGSSVTAPKSYAFNDPNFNVLYDFAEITISLIIPPGPSSDITYQPFIDTTQVDNWSLPIMLGLYSFDTDNPTVKTPYQPSGAPATNLVAFNGARDTLVSNIVTGLTTPWDNLALPFHTNPYSPGGATTYLRILAPKTSTTQVLPQPEGDYTIPQFPTNYLTSPTNYLSLLWAHYTGGTSLYIQATGGSNEIYTGTASGTVFTFTSGANTVTLDYTSITVAEMYGGVLPFVNVSAPAGDIPILQNLFGSAFTVGLLGVPGVFDSSATPLNNANLQDHLPRSGGPITSPAYYNIPGIFPSGSYNFYAQLLHANAITPTSPPYTTPPTLPTVGLCYAYDYDDTLGMSSTASPPANTPTATNLYAIFTLGTIATLPTGVFDDSAAYDLTFTFPSAVTFQYRQGNSGSFTTASSPAHIPTPVTSTLTNPFQISLNGYIFNVFPKYQFFQPIGAFTTAHSTVFNGTIFTPNVASAPTAFTIALPAP